jgi:hypothetical protein
MFGKIGRAGLNSIKDRQHEQEHELTGDLNRSFALLEDLLRMQPRREYSLFSVDTPRFVVASDAAYENERGTAGFLVVLDPGLPEETRHGMVVHIPEEIYNHWGKHKTYIAQLELLVVLVGLLEFAPRLRGRRGLWFIDNVAALMALVRGRSNSPSLDAMSLCIHAGLYALSTWMYFEWVSSESNWADGVSRQGWKDPWARRHAFSLSDASFITALLTLPFPAAVKVFAYL